LLCGGKVAKVLRETETGTRKANEVVETEDDLSTTFEVCGSEYFVLLIEENPRIRV